jgi:hypothetical protein
VNRLYSAFGGYELLSVVDLDIEVRLYFMTFDSWVIYSVGKGPPLVSFKT